jgi:hypothetical protein
MTNRSAFLFKQRANPANKKPFQKHEREENAASKDLRAKKIPLLLERA